jgi:hypothetical protein
MKRRHLFGGGIVLAGLVLTLLQIGQGVQQNSGFASETRALVFAVETMPFVLTGLALSFVGYWLTIRPAYEQDLPRIAIWTLGSTLLFASIGALLVFSQQVKPTVDILEQAPSLVTNQITVGALVGVLVGLYDARGLATQRALERERDRVELFAKKAMDINTYGRELNRADSIDAVSALCIQAVQGFLGLNETAFVLVSDTEVELVDNTVVNVPDDALADLARQSRDQEPRTVVTNETVPAALNEHTDSAISVLITEYEGTSVVLLALTDDATTFDEEDVQLLELLLNHAATALDHITHVDDSGDGTDRDQRRNP